MKKLLLILLLIPLFSLCQSTSHSMNMQTDDSAIVLSKFIQVKNVSYCFDQRQKDTIPTLLLVCDTSKKGNGKWVMIGEDADRYNHTLYWVKGYSIREKHDNTEGIIDPYIMQGFKYQEYYEPIGEYLDSEKKKLKPSIIVWMTKYIK